jgi:hypothetical protein
VKTYGLSLSLYNSALQLLGLYVVNRQDGCKEQVAVCFSLVAERVNVYAWVEEDNGDPNLPSMEPETTAVLRKDMAGCVAVGVVRCRRCVSRAFGLSIGVDVRYIEMAPVACRVTVRPVKSASLRGSYLVGLFLSRSFLSTFLISLCRLCLFCLSSFCLCICFCL